MKLASTLLTLSVLAIVSVVHVACTADQDLGTRAQDPPSGTDPTAPSAPGDTRDHVVVPTEAGLGPTSVDASFPVLDAGACPPQMKLCSFGCAVKYDPHWGCGESCQECVVANGTPACVADACVIGSCAGGYNACGGQCVANSASACGPSCTPCSGSTPVCAGTRCVQCASADDCGQVQNRCNAANFCEPRPIWGTLNIRFNGGATQAYTDQYYDDAFYRATPQTAGMRFQTDKGWMVAAVTLPGTVHLGSQPLTSDVFFLNVSDAALGNLVGGWGPTGGTLNLTTLVMQSGGEIAGTITGTLAEFGNPGTATFDVQFRAHLP